MINWMKYRVLYFAISAIVLLAGIFAVGSWGLPLGIDFTGGVEIEYRVNGVSKVVKLKEISPEEREKNKKDEVRFEKVGPTIGPELVRKTIYAMLFASVVILFWVAYQFRNLKFGVSAIVAMLHDSLVLLGVYAIVGKYFGAEIDFLFVTAMLTVLSFSVHDTIVVYDRVRELQRKRGGNLTELANFAISETMVRSLNNSFTIIFMLVALILLGGESIRWFAVALLIGTVSGTYSSPFVAVPLLVTWDELEKKRL